MSSRKHISLLLVLVVAVIALCAATGAEAAYSLNGICDDGPGECAITADGWVMEIIRGTGVHAGQFPVVCDGTDTSYDCIDKRGNPITGYRFTYRITAPKAGSLLSQANLLCSDCGAGNQISITYPADRSVKMLTEDPNSKYGAGDPDFVITWDALKLDPSNHANIAVYTTKAGAGLKGAMLKTGTGYEYIDQILGPVCCKQTQVVSQITVNGSTVNYDACTGDFTNTDLTPVVGDLWVCWSTTGTFDSKQCDTIKKIGPQFGAFLDVDDKFCPNLVTRYYGYGNKFFQECVSFIQPPPSPVCTDATAALVEDAITFDGKIEVTYNACGFPTAVNGIPAEIWIFKSSANGKMDPGSGGPVVNSGPRHGGIIYTNPWIYFMGGWKWIP